MKIHDLIFFLFLLSLPLQAKSRFDELWAEVVQGPYRVEKLPHESVSFFHMAAVGLAQIFKDAKRTITTEEDILPYFNKLVHPNGVCFKGLWEIETQNPYSGYFAKGKKGLVVARASSALSEVKRGERRSFGMGLKLYPNTDEFSGEEFPTANIFLIDDLGGTRVSHYQKTALTNTPELSFGLGQIFKGPLAALVGKAFSAADQSPSIRQLYPISELNLAANELALTPKKMRLKATSGQQLSGQEDFRLELLESLQLNNGNLRFDIEVRGELNGSEGEEFQKIGTITFDEAALSEGCDHRLHFQHPKWCDHQSPEQCQ